MKNLVKALMVRLSKSKEQYVIENIRDFLDIPDGLRSLAVRDFQEWVKNSAWAEQHALPRPKVFIYPTPDWWLEKEKEHAEKAAKEAAKKVAPVPVEEDEDEESYW